MRTPRLARWTLAAILAVHLLAASRVIAPTSLLGPEPFYDDDFPLHFARAALVAEELPRTGRLWLYDPTVMAGYPLGATVFDLDNVGTAALMALLPLSPAHAFKLVVWACLALAPLGAWTAARALGFAADESLAAAAAAVVVGATTITFRLGMYADFAGAWLAVVVVALTHRWLARPTAARFVALVAVGAGSLWLHALVGVLVLLPCTLLVAGAARAAPRQTLVGAVLVAGAIVLLCAPWLVPLVRFARVLGADYPSPFFQTGSLASAWALLRGGGGWQLFFLASGAFGLALLVWRREWRLAIVLGAWVVMLLVASVQGSRLGVLARLQPLRLLVPLAFALCPLAGVGVAALVRAVLRAGATSPAPALILAPLLFVPHLVLGLRALASLSPVDATLPPAAHELVDWLRASTEPTARILVEDRLHVEPPPRDRDVPDHPWFGGHLPALLPRLLDRELLGGPYPEMPIRPHRADLSSGVFFGAPIATWPAERFAAQLARYNVGWIVAWSSATRAYLAALPAVVEPVGTRGVFHLFRRRAPASFFVEGAGTIDARPNALAVDASSTGRVVLAYHWYPGLCTDPPLPIGPWEAPDLAAPFIAVDHGATPRFVVRPTRDWLGRCR